MPARPLSADDLPLLGETPAVELANTRYGGGDDAIDFLAEPFGAAWLRFGPASTSAHAMGEVGVEALRALRDAAFDALEAVRAERAPGREVLAVLNAAAARAPSSPRVIWRGRRAHRELMRDGTVVDVTLAAFADDTIDVLCGPRRASLRRCAAPDCSMLFVQQHRRRRFCHPSCGQRVRQAAYHARLRARR